MNLLMKIFFTLFVLFFSSLVFAETYYCMQDDNIGYDKSESSKTQKFNLRQFTIDIDFKNKKVLTDDDERYLGYASFVPTECITYGEHEIYCMNIAGVAFSFNENTKQFKMAKILNTDKNTDDETLGYGKCSKF